MLRVLAKLTFACLIAFPVVAMQGCDQETKPTATTSPTDLGVQSDGSTTGPAGGIGGGGSTGGAAVPGGGQ
jgi:hypothetical protein